MPGCLESSLQASSWGACLPGCLETSLLANLRGACLPGCLESPLPAISHPSSDQTPLHFRVTKVSNHLLA